MCRARFDDILQRVAGAHVLSSLPVTHASGSRRTAVKDRSYDDVKSNARWPPWISKRAYASRRHAIGKR